MNAILGMAELLSETPLNEDKKKYVEVFRSAGDNLLSIINDILNWKQDWSKSPKTRMIAQLLNW
jgi:signal transduction histidine kinase